MSDRDLGYRELCLDPLFPTLEPHRYREIIDRALAIGSATAAAFAGQRPEQVAERLGVRIDWREGPIEVAGQTVRADYDSGARTITISVDSVRAVQQVLSALNSGGLLPLMDITQDSARTGLPVERRSSGQRVSVAQNVTHTMQASARSVLAARHAGSNSDSGAEIPFWAAAVRLHIAHELFHHLEATGRIAADLPFPTVSTWRLGPWLVGMRCIGRCREIAAHKFAKDLTGLPFLPNSIDWLIEAQLELPRPAEGMS